MNGAFVRVQGDAALGVQVNKPHDAAIVIQTDLTGTATKASILAPLRNLCIGGQRGPCRGILGAGAGALGRFCFRCGSRLRGLIAARLHFFNPQFNLAGKVRVLGGYGVRHLADAQLRVVCLAVKCQGVVAAGALFSGFGRRQHLAGDRQTQAIGLKAGIERSGFLHWGRCIGQLLAVMATVSVYQ